MRNRNYIPFFAPAKFATACHETGRQIKAGERAAFYRMNGKWVAYHEESNQAGELRALHFASDCGMADANW